MDYCISRPCATGLITAQHPIKYLPVKAIGTYGIDELKSCLQALYDFRATVNRAIRPILLSCFNEEIRQQHMIVRDCYGHFAKKVTCLDEVICSWKQDGSNANAEKVHAIFWGWRYKKPQYAAQIEREVMKELNLRYQERADVAVVVGGINRRRGANVNAPFVAQLVTQQMSAHIARVTKSSKKTHGRTIVVSKRKGTMDAGATWKKPKGGVFSTVFIVEKDGNRCNGSDLVDDWDGNEGAVIGYEANGYNFGGEADGFGDGFNAISFDGGADIHQDCEDQETEIEKMRREHKEQLTAMNEKVRYRWMNFCNIKNLLTKGPSSSAGGGIGKCAASSEYASSCREKKPESPVFSSGDQGTAADVTRHAHGTLAKSGDIILLC